MKWHLNINHTEQRPDPCGKREVETNLIREQHMVVVTGCRPKLEGRKKHHTHTHTHTHTIDM